MSRYKKKQKGIKITTKVLMLFIVLITVVFVMVWSFQFKKYKQISKAMEGVQEEIDERMRIKANLEKEKNYQDSDAFIEEVARRELNMIKQNELIIVNDRNRVDSN